ncbi:hypothetical protein RO3G_10862 [Rhizopus delemar RA 99-880]|uniref:Tc1-like transposase DDE domain-containing protein n=1 Tax=Rhizopus delemar (strain RA 99-880 / ATCC MYA-4621 / FGSC 9543 / NRRL 43880) TaxID=246409 RepID=I1CCH1_RHIO9|nr:hypothetical protein RO3G_10862 [Rhizopus delemar RA 99-880]|eukprot:EIE86151.1 hypothetical protein RO3G_10862 [Rhizopus delemar RA 99-880]
MAHKDWTTDDWRRMVFSDETKVNVFGSDCCKYYWSRPDDALQPHHLDLTVKGGQGSVIVWGCITYDGPGIVYTILRMSIFNKIRILSTLRSLLSNGFVDNNFNSEHIYSWPAQSPNLNPIEHVWHHLKLKLSVYDTKAKGVHELWEKIEKEWNTFTVDECRRYIDSMPVRCKAVIKPKRGHTRY